MPLINANFCRVCACYYLYKHPQPDAPKLTTLTLAAKLLTLNPQAQILQKLASYVLTLARWDSSYDVRDRGRWLSGLVRGFLKSEEGEAGENEDGEGEDGKAGVVLRPEQVRVVLFEGKEGSVDLPLWREDGTFARRGLDVCWCLIGWSSR